jgi:hypothetical protein
MQLDDEPVTQATNCRAYLKAELIVSKRGCVCMSHSFVLSMMSFRHPCNAAQSAAVPAHALIKGGYV